MARDPRTGLHTFVRLMGDPDMAPDAPATLDGGRFAEPQREPPKPAGYAEQLEREQARQLKIQQEEGEA